MKNFDETIVYLGFSYKQLCDAFDLVKDGEHWKNPIDSLCTTEEVAAVAAAIWYFTATKPIFDYIGKVETSEHKRFKENQHIMKVRADGYRRGPAGDH